MYRIVKRRNYGIEKKRSNVSVREEEE